VQLAGTLTGPFCEYAQTLPATIPFADLGPGRFPLAQAIAPDPCFWTPELPYLYRACLEWQRGRQVLAAVERDFGIRPLGARGRQFYYAGKPWVFRGVTRRAAALSDLPACREADAALCIEDPNDDMCAAASRQGVLLVARLNGTAATSANIRRLSRHAAVGFILLDDASPPADFRSLAPNVLFVSPLERLAPQALLCSSDGIANSSLPVIAYRPASAMIPISQQRALCDELQRDLAGIHHVAGYLV
jgi:hypothetical protein